MARVATSLRGRQRLVVHDAVLDAALALFADRGYPKTTMQAIADRAEIGIATLFRHFQGKASVLAALVLRDLDRVLAEAQKIVDDPPSEPKKALTAFLLTIATLLDQESKGIRIKPHTWPAMLTGEPETDAVVAHGDAEVRRMIAALLEHFKKTGQLRPGLPIGDLTEIVFYVFNSHYVGYIFGTIGSRADLDAKIKKRTGLLLEAWFK